MLCGKWISIIYASPAYAQDGKVVIGKNGDIPWRGMVPSDMERFVDLTSNHSIVMGRKTWDSLSPKFKPLPNRQNIILTRNLEFEIGNPEVVVVHSIEEAAQLAKSRVVWVAGGAEVYALALPYTDFIHQTMIHERFKGDAFFPCYDRDAWKTIDFMYFNAGGERSPKDRLDSYYLVFQRKEIRLGK